MNNKIINFYFKILKNRDIELNPTNQTYLCTTFFFKKELNKNDKLKYNEVKYFSRYIFSRYLFLLNKLIIPIHIVNYCIVICVFLMRKELNIIVVSVMIENII